MSGEKAVSGSGSELGTDVQPAMHCHEFLESISERSVTIRISQLNGAFVVVVSADHGETSARVPERLTNLSFATPTRQNGSEDSTSKLQLGEKSVRIALYDTNDAEFVCGSSFSSSMAARLSQNVKKQVFLSINAPGFEADPSFFTHLEKRLLDFLGTRLVSERR